MRKKRLIIFCCAFISALVLALTFKPMFWIIIPLAPASLLIYLAMHFSKTKWVGAIISLACLLVFFSITEAYLDTTKVVTARYDWSGSKYITSGATTHEYRSNWTKDDPILVVGSKPMQVQTASKRMDGDTVTYDVLYSWDEQGRRITPNNLSTANNLVLLLGCSYTFGEALNDKETFAWKLSEQLGTNFQVFNYGFSGYGSHQMLALLKSDRLDYLKEKYDNVYAFFLTFSGMENRSYGMPFWDSFGPKYVLEKDKLTRVGQLNTSAELKGIFGKSRFLKELRKIHVRQVYTDDMLDLHAAIILESKEIFNKKFGGEFITVVYPNYGSLKERLSKKDMKTIDLDMYFDDFKANKINYIISKYDAHPNLKATDLIARAMYEYIEKNKE